MSFVVVGLDGSPCSKHALRFAAEESRLRGTQLRAVCAWQVPVGVYMGSNMVPTLDPAEFSAFVTQQMETWGKVVKDANIHLG